ncbi:MAG: PAS domain S-box protein [Gemmatimonadota bacterium]|nr:MAG: PAS domain S-box protein [Gemmatimonadota bacterium]
MKDGHTEEDQRKQEPREGDRNGVEPENVKDKTDQALRTRHLSEDRYQALFDRSLYCVYVHDFEGRFLDANQTALDLLGYNREDILVLDFSSLLDGDQLEKAHKALEEIKQTGVERKPTEYQLRKKDGSFVWVEAESSVLFRDGIPYAVQGVARDVTHRKTTEAALRNAEEQFRSLFENSMIGLYRTSPEGEIFMANPALVRMLGYSSFEELKNRNLEETGFEPNYCRSTFKQRVEREGQVTGLEASWTRSDGTTIFVRESVRCARDESGNVLYYEGTVEDITERTQAEEALRIEKAYLEQLFESAQEAIVMADMEGNVQRINSEFRRLFGYTREETLGQSLDELVAPGELLEEAESITATVSSGEKVAAETLRRRKDGRLFNVSILASPIIVGKDQVGVYGIYRDITDRVRTEKIQRVLYQISNAANTTEDLTKLYKSIHHVLGTVLDTTNFFIALYDRDNDVISLPYFINEKDSYTSFPAGKSLISYVISQDASLLLTEEDIRKLKHTGEVEEVGAPAKVWVGVPLRVGQDVVGAVGVQSYRDVSRYTEKHLEILEFVSDQIALAIQFKQKEEGLRLEKAYLEQLFESAQEAIVMADNNGRIMRLNSEFVRLFGYEREEAIGRSIDDLIAPENLRDEAVSITDKVTHGQNVAIESLRRRKDGMLINVSVLASPINVGEEQVALYGIYRDITGRKQSEEALRESEEKYRNLIDQSRDAIYLLFNGKFEIINKRFEELFGYNQEETNAPEFNFMNLVSPKSVPVIEERIEKVKRGETVPPQYEFTAVSRDGTEVVVETSVSYIQYKGGIATQGVLRDITERVRAEKALREYATELERSNQELEHFAYIASHDLQEPLRMIASYMQLLKRRYSDRLDSDATEFIGFAVDGAVRMQNLINDLLAFSRVGTRGKPFKPTKCEDVLKQVLVNLKVAIEESQARVTHDALPAVVADGTQLVQVFQNLIGNAIKFRSAMNPEIHVGVVRDNGEWRFSVADNGIGIDSQYTERIFRIFQRLHTKDEYPGTGAGLAICKKIVERHGGRIWAGSQPEQGSIFYFTIPMQGETSL